MIFHLFHKNVLHHPSSVDVNTLQCLVEIMKCVYLLMYLLVYYVLCLTYVLSLYFRQTSESKLKCEDLWWKKSIWLCRIFHCFCSDLCVCSAADVHRSSRDLSVMTMSTLQSKWTQRILQQIQPLLTLKQPIREQDAMRDACPTRNRYSFNIIQ